MSIKRIRILPDQIASGETLVGIGKKRMPEWMSIINSHNPIPLIEPASYQGKLYSVVVPYELSAAERKYRVRFLPVWARCYKVCHLRSSEIRSVTCDFGDRQLTFDMEAMERTGFTMLGPGCDPAVVREAEVELGRLIHEQPNTPAVARIIAYLKSLPQSLKLAA